MDAKGNLCLRRKVGEKVSLYDENDKKFAEIELSAIKGNRAVLVFRANGEISIKRNELEKVPK